MRPEITRFEPFGYHNENWESEQERIRATGAWKHQRIVIVLPAARLVPVKCAVSWWNLAFPPNNSVVKYVAEGMEVGAAYSEAIEAILTNPGLRDWEYLLTVEHDNVVPAEAALQLLRAMEEHPEFDCISSIYWTKGVDGVPQIWGDPESPELNFLPQEPKGGVQECQGTGMGFALWRLKMFKDERLPRPLFQTKADDDGVASQDLFFWAGARPLGYRCAVDCNCRVGHIDFKGDFGKAGKIW